MIRFKQFVSSLVTGSSSTPAAGARPAAGKPVPLPATAATTRASEVRRQHDAKAEDPGVSKPLTSRSTRSDSFNDWFSDDKRHGDASGEPSSLDDEGQMQSLRVLAGNYRMSDLKAHDDATHRKMLREQADRSKVQSLPAGATPAQRLEASRQRMTAAIDKVLAGFEGAQKNRLCNSLTAIVSTQVNLHHRQALEDGTLSTETIERLIDEAGDRGWPET